MNRLTSIVVAAAAACCGAPSSAAIIQEFHDDFLGWSSAAGDFTTIDFTGFPDFTPITYEYQDLGVVFPELELIVGPAPDTFVNDGWGLNGVGFIDIDFTSPMTSLAIHHPGFVFFRLYSDDELIYESGFFGGSGTGFFSGVISDTPFDRAQLWDFFDDIVAIDDLHFGPPVPGAATIATFAVAALGGRTRRRRG